jgi:hypothetical protein
MSRASSPANPLKVAESEAPRSISIRSPQTTYSALLIEQSKRLQSSHAVEPWKCAFLVTSLKPLLSYKYGVPMGGLAMIYLLDVEVWGGGIIVTMPGTNYWVRYFKEKGSP